MSFYFRHMKDVLEEAGVEVTKENKKEIDQIIHELVNVPYKQCSPVWKAVKKQIKMDDKDNGVFVEKLKKRLGSGSRS
jgi:ribosomal protein L18E